MTNTSIIDMVDDGYIAYKFIAPILHGNVYNTYEEYIHAKNSGSIPPPFLPKLQEGVYIIESGEIISTIYSFLYGKHHVRIKNNEVTEYFVHDYSAEHTCQTYDINTLEIIERYNYNCPGEEQKFCAKSGALLQINYLCPFSGVPEDIKSSLIDFPYKDNIFAWANKPYGTAIYFNF